MQRAKLSSPMYILFVLIFCSAVSLSIPISLAILISALWTWLTEFVLKKGGRAAKIGMIAPAYLLGLGATYFILHLFSGLVNHSAQPDITASSYTILFLISLWTLLLYHSLSDLAAHFSIDPQKSQNAYRADANTQNAARQNKVLPDLSLLEDGRALDIAKLGIFDGKFGLPSSYIQKISDLANDLSDDLYQPRARRALECLKKLETAPPSSFEIFQVENDQDDLSLDLGETLLQFAEQSRSKIITMDTLAYKSDKEAGSPIISLDMIAALTRPPLSKGEYTVIKIQRLGKEPKQGIGYLDDGTMVVVNGGGDFLGSTIKTQFLSQKYSSSGRIVFCNALPLTHPVSGDSPISSTMNQTVSVSGNYLGQQGSPED